MATFKVTCTETAVYEFDVEAPDEDAAWFLAHDILLGGNGHDGAIRLEEPDGTHIMVSIPDRDWDIEEI